MSKLISRGGPLVALTVLAACSQTPRPGIKALPTVQAVGNAQQYSDVVSSLEAGDLKRARKLLKKMATRDPADRQVHTLLESIDGDPVALLGSKAFDYRVKRGETMISLSQRFLGERLKFYLLVRYNLLNDSRVAVGQVIRIPGIAPPTPPVAVRPKPQVQQPVAAPSPRADGPSANPAFAALLRGRALAALNQGRVAVAVMTLRRAREADPASAAVERDLVRAERLLATVKARK